MTSRPGAVDRRFRVVRLLLAAVGLVLAARLVQVQVVQHQRWRDEAQRQWLQTRDIPARRGDLVDREGRPLALTISAQPRGYLRLPGRESRGFGGELLSDVFGRLAG